MKRRDKTLKTKELNPTSPRELAARQLAETMSKLHELRAAEKRAQNVLVELEALRDRQDAYLVQCIAAQRALRVSRVDAAGARAGAGANAKPCALTANSGRDPEAADSQDTQGARAAIRATAAGLAAKETELRGVRHEIAQLEVRRDMYRFEIGQLSAHLPLEVSDHAALDYLAATRKLDLKAVRDEILSAHLTALVDALGDGLHSIDLGSPLVARVKNHKILAIEERGAAEARRDSAHAKRLTRARIARMTMGDDDYDRDAEETWAPGHGGRALQTPVMRRAAGAR